MLAATLHKPLMRPRTAGAEEVRGMGYIIAWLLGVPVTLLILFWLFFGS